MSKRNRRRSHYFSPSGVLTYCASRWRFQATFFSIPAGEASADFIGIFKDIPSMRFERRCSQMSLSRMSSSGRGPSVSRPRRTRSLSESPAGGTARRRLSRLTRVHLMRSERISEFIGAFYSESWGANRRKDTEKVSFFRKMSDF